MDCHLVDLSHFRCCYCSCRSSFLANDANYSNLRWLWVFFLLLLYCLLMFSHVFHQTVGYVHSQATIVGMPTGWLGWTCPTLPWESWTCLSNLCSYLPPRMIVVFDWGWYNCEILFMPMKITVPVWVMDYAHWWPWTCEVLEHCFFYLLLMLLMAVIKPCETSMPKQQLDNSDNLMARLDASHGFMSVMILVFYYLFEVCCCLCFLRSKFKVKWKGN